MGAIFESAKIPTKYSLVHGVLRKLGATLRTHEDSIFLNQFLINFLGPLFYDLILPATITIPSIQDSSSISENIHLSSVLKFCCFVYLDTIEYDGTEDIFEAMAFVDRFEVCELQEHCLSHLTHFMERRGNVCSPLDRRFRGNHKRLCDQALMFIGGRMPFYFNEAELDLLPSVVLETVLDYNYLDWSEFELTERVISWLRSRWGAARRSSKRNCFSATQFLLLIAGILLCSNTVTRITVVHRVELTSWSMLWTTAHTLQCSFGNATQCFNWTLSIFYIVLYCKDL